TAPANTGQPGPTPSDRCPPPRPALRPAKPEPKYGGYQPGPQSGRGSTHPRDSRSRRLGSALPPPVVAPAEVLGGGRDLPPASLLSGPDAGTLRPQRGEFLRTGRKIPGLPGRRPHPIDPAGPDRSALLLCGTLRLPDHRLALQSDHGSPVGGPV